VLAVGGVVAANAWLLACALTSACAFDAEPADALADEIVRESGRLLDGSEGAQIDCEHLFDSTDPFLVALLPDRVALDRVLDRHAVSADR
jgi:hypothetical protein